MISMQAMRYRATSAKVFHRGSLVKFLIIFDTPTDLIVGLFGLMCVSIVLGLMLYSINCISHSTMSSLGDGGKQWILLGQAFALKNIRL